MDKKKATHVQDHSRGSEVMGLVLLGLLYCGCVV